MMEISKPRSETSLSSVPVGIGYALWLMPEEPMFSLLAGTIARLSREYSTPRFDPHVTLLSGILAQEQDALAKAALLASALKPLRLELAEVGYLDEYFRCLFIRVVEGGPIIQAHRAAQEVFGLQNNSPYVPHLSLMYGNLRMEEKQHVAEDLNFQSGQVVEVRKLSLFRVSGAPRQWRYVEEFGLK